MKEIQKIVLVQPNYEMDGLELENQLGHPSTQGSGCRDQKKFFHVLFIKEVLPEFFSDS